MSGFEEWAKSKEASAEELTKLLIDIRTPADFLLTFLIVAVIAGIGEELLFRGVIQNKLFALFKNIHVAIWFSAILFSAIHLQFYGFIPRMMLGVIFGYLYYWSNNIWVPIIAHFTNNGFTVLGMYLFNMKMVNYNLEDTTKAPIGMAISSLIITSGLMFSFWKYYTGKKLLQ
jgi:membrane protease YdiL (CAAX protease family)